MTDPLLVALMRRMLPEEGQPFPAERRKLFLSAVEVILAIIYAHDEPESKP